ncbi:hypothetical protein AVEN_100904-1 [Araneus ventricosus]|uniref:Uncharacterized protein n=1 Tax=Araneus ventricosus TaxID=182803 RepID=A0A4Y2AYD8_ARAVE|nr:hypothetical protein AVEN_100904-1 [Araneus ventricosus]
MSEGEPRQVAERSGQQETRFSVVLEDFPSFIKASFRLSSTLFQAFLNLVPGFPQPCSRLSSTRLSPTLFQAFLNLVSSLSIGC